VYQAEHTNAQIGQKKDQGSGKMSCIKAIGAKHNNGQQDIEKDSDGGSFFQILYDPAVYFVPYECHEHPFMRVASIHVSVGLYNNIPGSECQAILMTTALAVVHA
jgi:hypothetical protein